MRPTEAGTSRFTPIRRRLLQAVKVLVTVLLCAWIVAVVDWNALAAELRQCRLGIVLAVVGFYFLGLAITSYKWQQLLAVHDLTYGLMTLQKWYLVATFLNHFLPTSIGGDGYRVYKTLHNANAKSCAVLAVVVERITGLLALLLMGYVAAIVTYLRDGDQLSGVATALGTLGLLSGVLVGGVLLRWRLIENLMKRPACPKWVGSLLDHASDYRRHPRQTALACAVSFVFQANCIFCFWLLIRALGMECGFPELTVAVAMMNVIGLLPISFGGLGVVDASFIFVTGNYGVNPETALSVMLLSRVLLLPMSLLGGYFYLVGDGDREAKKQEFQQDAGCASHSVT